MKYQVDIIRYGQVEVEADCGWQACRIAQAMAPNDIQWLNDIKVIGTMNLPDSEE